MDEKALSTLTPEQTSVIPAIVQQMMGPLVEAMAKLLENNTAALQQLSAAQQAVSYTHLRAHETGRNLVCRLLLEKKKKKKQNNGITL